MKLNLKVKYVACLAVLSFMKVKLIDCHIHRNRNGTIYAKNLQSEPEENENVETDLYTFTALIEIMFNDGSKKNCTGAIIHDNVVITAAHCFVPRDDLLQPELTGSFVIIGSKNMFTSGYEQYLPIERIVIHPNYTGWTSDLALVFTFSGMISDKPGNILPLADGNSFTSVHSNVTVLSWNTQKKKDVTTTKKLSHGDSCSELSEEDKSGRFSNEVTRPYWTKPIIYVPSNEDTQAKETNNQQSTLYADDYTILEVQTCKQLIRKLKPSLYQIQNENETICYSKTKPFNINGQSGAPSIHRNHLVTVAAGEILSDKEHIIIGTKISCFCNWIMENLPGGGDHLNCCKDCCNILDKQLNQTFMFLK